MNINPFMKTVLSVQLHEMSELVLSKITLRYREENIYSFLEDLGTVETLCAKYQIGRSENGSFNVNHFGRKCMLGIENGITFFKGFC